MSLYLDASVLVPLFAVDRWNDRAETLLVNASDMLLLSDFARAEVSSAISRKVREELLTDAQARAVFTAFDAWAPESAHDVTLEAGDVGVAEALVRRLVLKLRAPDAIHLAIAIRQNAKLATFDRRLASGARAIGLDVVS